MLKFKSCLRVSLVWHLSFEYECILVVLGWSSSVALCLPLIRAQQLENPLEDIWEAIACSTGRLGGKEAVHDGAALARNSRHQGLARLIGQQPGWAPQR